MRLRGPTSFAGGRRGRRVRSAGDHSMARSDRFTDGRRHRRPALAPRCPSAGEGHGTITAVENPDVTVGQLAALEARLRVHDGEPASESYVSSPLQAASGAGTGGSLK